MTPQIAPGAGIEERLLAFEQAAADPNDDGNPDDRMLLELDPFAPPPGDPERPAVLAELIRLALEFGWDRGRPRSVAEYRARFPELESRPKSVADIAFEEFRLRSRAGENVDPGEYARQGVNLDYWPETLAAMPPTAMAGASGVRDLSDPELESISQGFRDCASCSGGSNLDDDTKKFIASLQRSQPHMIKELASVYDSMPRPGEQFLDFQLGTELGRGAFGRVFLARQTSLATRRVVLKIVAAGLERDESQTLARLHHSNIVPIHSAHRRGPLFAICMPYMGDHTLEHVIRAREQAPAKRGASRSWSRPSRNKADRGWVSAHGASAAALASAPGEGIASAPAPVPAPPAPSAPAQPPAAASGAGAGPGGAAAALTASALTSGSTLASGGSANVSSSSSKRLSVLVRRFSDIEEVLRVTAKLAGGLEYAHRRGFAHGDLKPANILLANDGEPKLLDFNLARKLRKSGGLAADRLGGTLPYMAPEQLAAIAYSADQRPPADPRSDLYALGVILYELLTGRRPFDNHAGPIELIVPLMIHQRRSLRIAPRELNPNVSPAVEAITRKCLAPDPKNRYQSARELKRDLHRHLRDRPLRYAQESSWVERFAKWRRRRPKTMLATAVVLVTAIIGAVLLLGSSRYEEQQFLAELRQQGDQNRMAILELNKGPQVIMSLLASDPLKLNQLSMNRGSADFSSVPALGLLPSERAEVRRLNAFFFACRALALAVQARELRLSGAEGEIGDQLLASALSTNTAAIKVFPDGQAPRELSDRAWRWLMDLETLPNSPADLRVLPPQDAYWRAMEFLAFRKPAEALRLLEYAARAEPDDPWHSASLAVCHYELGHRTAALTFFSSAIARLPEIDRLRYWRGLLLTEEAEALESQGQFAEASRKAALALDDFDRIVQGGREVSKVRLDRAQAKMVLGDYASALEDLDFGSRTESIKSLMLKAHCLQELDQMKASVRVRDQALRMQPSDAYDYFFRAMNRPPGPEALQDLKDAIRANPRFLPARLLQARILIFQGRLAEAQAALERIEGQIDPGNREAKRLADEIRARQAVGGRQ